MILTLSPLKLQDTKAFLEQSFITAQGHGDTWTAGRGAGK